MSTCLLITTCSRTLLLINSLQALRGKTLPDEVLIVDDGGGDHCAELLAAAELPCDMRYIYTHNLGNTQCSHARNVGIKNTDCDLIITSEPELMYESDVVAQMQALHYGEHPREVINAGLIHHVQENGHIQDTVGWMATFTALYEKQWLLDVGGWDEGFPDPWGWDDTDLLTRLRCHLGVGEFVDTSIVATHQFHRTRWNDQERNEKYFRAKLTDDPNVMLAPIANVGKEWGVIKER